MQHCNDHRQSCLVVTLNVRTVGRADMPAQLEIWVFGCVSDRYRTILANRQTSPK